MTNELIEAAQTVQCTRCRNKHAESDRVKTAPDKDGMRTLACPRCGGHSYYLISGDPA